MKRRDLLLLAATCLLGGIAAGCTAAAQPANTPTLPPATAQVVRTTLVETRTVSGILGYGELTPVSSPATGMITWLAPEGIAVAQGEPLFKIDEEPVVAFYGAVPLYRTLSNRVQGPDVRQLQENLAALGYTGFDIDGLYTHATAEAVRAWQADLGLAQTGVVEPGELVFTPGPVRIAEHMTHVGAVLGDGNTSILSYTGTDRLVTVDLGVSDQSLAVVGNEVTITLPGRATVSGQIAEVGTVVTAQELEVTVTIADQEALGTLEAAPVDVDFVSAAREDVLAVPIAALLALAEGGYGVEVVEGNTTYILAVQTGMFARGRVEISGEGIVEGMTVGVPR